MNRRKFLKKSVLGIGACLASPLLFAVKKEGMSYKVEIPRGFKCHRCKKAVEFIMKDKKMRKEVERRFPEGAEVVFYVGRHKSYTKVAEHAVAVGKCSRDLQKKTDCYLKLCTQAPVEKHAKMVYTGLIKKMKKIR